MSKRLLTNVIQHSSDLNSVAFSRLAAGIIAAIKTEIIETGRFSLPDFGSFTVREPPKLSALNPRSGEKVVVKASAMVKFKAPPSSSWRLLPRPKRAKRKAAKATKSA